MLSTSSTGSFPASSLTQYFSQQSLGRLTLYGDVYPSVVVTDNNESFYGISGTNLTSLNGMATLTEEVLDEIDLAGFDFSDYDDNSDGYVDHIFFVLRRNNNPISWAGFSILGNPSLPELSYDGVSIDWNLSGSYNRYSFPGNIVAELNFTRLMAHEFGHDIWTNTVLGQTHIVPVNESNGTPSNGTNRIGYALMVGGTATDTRGDETISAFERDLLNDGWINCSSLSTNGTYTINDLYSSNTSNCRTVSIPIQNGSITANRTLYLSNRQRVGIFDQLQTISCTTPSSGEGLETTGLLVTYQQDRTSSPVHQDRYAVIPADNDLVLSISSSDYIGDMFDSPNFTQLTPWTRPNISGYTQYPPNFSMQTGNWQAVTEIQGSTGNSMTIEYLSDFRSNPIITEDSWIGLESSGSIITGDIVVETGTELTIESGTTLNFASGKGIQVYGTLTVNDAVLTASGSSWKGITFYSGSTGNLNNVDITKIGGGAGGSAILASGGSSVTIDDSFIDVNAGSYVYGVRASGGASSATINVTSSAIRSASAPAVTASGTGKSVYLYDTDIIQNSSYQALYTSSSAVIESRIPGIYYIGLNKVKGGKTYAQGSAVITFGGQHNLNHFCNTASSSLQTATGGVIYAGGNYWYNGVAPATSGSSIYSSPLQGTADCSDVVYRLVAEDGAPPDQIHSLVAQQSIDNDLAQLLKASSYRQQGHWNQAVDLLRDLLRESEGDLARAALLELRLVYEAHPEPSYKGLIGAMLTGNKAALESTALRVLADMYMLDEDWASAIPVLERIQASLSGQSDAFFADLSLASIYFTTKDETSLEMVLKRIVPTNNEEERVLQMTLYDMNRPADIISEAGEDRIESQRRLQEQSALNRFSIEAYPNPFNPSTTFTYMVPHQTRVVLKVYDSLGREVRTLVNGPVSAGEHTVSFEATALPSGAYVYRLEAGKLVQTGTIQLVK